MATCVHHIQPVMPDFVEFRSALQNVLNDIAAYRDELSSLMTERFQLFTRS